jgi:hypothetical protein
LFALLTPLTPTASSGKFWFEQYITEFTIKQLASTSGKSTYAIRNIIKHNLNNPPPNLFDDIDLARVKRIAYDGKFLLGRQLNLLVVFDTDTHKPIVIEFAEGENQTNITLMFKRLNDEGLNPDSMTCDGLPAIKKSAKKVWSNIKIQRCLFHIKLQVNAWTRKPPRTDLGRCLSKLVRHICNISTEDEIENFIRAYENILLDYIQIIFLLSIKNKGSKTIFVSVSRLLIMLYPTCLDIQKMGISRRRPQWLRGFSSIFKRYEVLHITV